MSAIAIWITLSIFGACMLGCAAFYVLSYPNARLEANERAAWPARGDRIRFLCAIPEHGINAGELGRVYAVYPADDLEFYIAPDRDTSLHLKFFDYELWQIERVD